MESVDPGLDTTYVYCAWCGGELRSGRTCRTCLVVWNGPTPTTLIPGREPRPPARKGRPAAATSAPPSSPAPTPVPTAAPLAAPAASPLATSSTSSPGPAAAPAAAPSVVASTPSSEPASPAAGGSPQDAAQKTRQRNLLPLGLLPALTMDDPRYTSSSSPDEMPAAIRAPPPSALGPPSSRPTPPPSASSFSPPEKPSLAPVSAPAAPSLSPPAPAPAATAPAAPDRPAPMRITSFGGVSLHDVHECPMCGGSLPSNRICPSCGIQWGDGVSGSSSSSPSAP